MPSFSTFQAPKKKKKKFNFELFGLPFDQGGLTKYRRDQPESSSRDGQN
jgi:hypothetical protein